MGNTSQVLFCAPQKFFVMKTMEIISCCSSCAAVIFFFCQENFITPDVFGEIIYNNFLFDIPKILDLCVLFGKGNAPLLHKMIGW